LRRCAFSTFASLTNKLNASVHRNCSHRHVNAIVALLVFIAVLSCSALALSPISLSGYREQLRAIAEKASALDKHPEQAGTLVAQIPDELTVETGEGQVTVNLRHVKDDLARLSAGDSKVKLPQINGYLQSLQAEAEAYDPTHTEVAASRQKLTQILSRREFKKVHELTARETILSRIYNWLARLFRRFHLGGSASFNVLQVIVYVLLAAALLLLLLWTISRLRRGEQDPPAKQIIPFSPSARSWRSWLAEARGFAAGQDWRNAIHLAYWAGISFLESGGAWKPNRARTPREYLQLLSTRHPNYTPLSALTGKFEIVWYGHRDAVEQDFQETLGQLEKLGCR
jgi:flagellar basal body-associated protein FliL